MRSPTAAENRIAGTASGFATGYGRHVGGRSAALRSHRRQPARRSLIMAASPSFDIVSKVDKQEVDNAFHQAEKELGTRFDFRGTGTSIAKSGENGVTITSETEE